VDSSCLGIAFMSLRQTLPIALRDRLRFSRTPELLSRADARLAALAAGWGRAGRFAHEFLVFGLKQAWASLFGALLLGLILASWLCYPRDAWLHRYDALTLAALAVQIGLVWSGLESLREARVIAVFHVVGTVMEVFKTAMGSWIYPEAALLRIGGVPLFTGFMYAAVGSYLARAWRLFDLRYTGHPPLPAVVLLALAIYLNFFAHHYLPDARWLLFVACAWLFRRTWVHYRIRRRHRRMPLLLGLALIALFVWLAENLGTFAGAWVYPSQRAAWSPVPLAKFGSWFLLMLISYALVAGLHGPGRVRAGETGR
jgi:uncharacterized membrane protein YoaT (DUF817 family)